MTRGTLIAVSLLTISSAAQEFDETRKSNSNPDIEIDAKAGLIELESWDRNAIRVVGTLGPYSEIDFDSDGDDANIEVTSTRGSKGGSADLRIYAPTGSSLHINTVSAPIRIQGFQGEAIEIETVSGEVFVDGAGGNIEIESVSGRIEMTDISGEISVDTVSSEIVVTGAPDELSVETVSSGVRLTADGAVIEVQTVSGAIHIGGEAVREVAAETISGDMRFQGSLGEDGEIEARSHGGTIDLFFTSPAYGEYDLSAFSGSINCELEPLNDVRTNGRRMRFEFGDGDTSIQAESFSGSINVE